MFLKEIISGFEKKPIIHKIKTDAKEQEADVPGVPVGDFIAVRRSKNLLDDEIYVVSHLPTGLSAGQFFSKDIAFEWATFLTRQLWISSDNQEAVEIEARHHYREYKAKNIDFCSSYGPAMSAENEAEWPD